MKQVIMSFSPTPCFVADGTPGPLNNEELGNIWLDWVAEFSPDCIRRYELVLLVQPRYALPDSTRAWGKVTRFAENHYISGWPLGPNRVFQQILWIFYHKRLQGPYLWCEADCIPVVPDWLDLIAEEYRRGGKPFMGAIVNPRENGDNRTPRHMTGNAVYPPDAFKLAPKIMEAYHTAWDVWSAEQVLPKCHSTDLIQHDWRRPEIQDRAELRGLLKPNTVVFHSDKYGAIARILGGGETAGHAAQNVPIVEYARSRGVVGDAQEPAQIPPLTEPQLASYTLNEFPVEQILGHLRALSESDPLIKKQIARFMVTNGLVNRGHIGIYLRKAAAPARKPQIEDMSAEEFRNRLQRGKHADPAEVAS